MEIKRMEENQGENTTIEESIDRKLQEAEIPGCEVEFDPDEAEKIAMDDPVHQRGRGKTVCKGFP
jgi:hypothetical protein